MECMGFDEESSPTVLVIAASFLVCISSSGRLISPRSRPFAPPPGHSPSQSEQSDLDRPWHACWIRVDCSRPLGLNTGIMPTKSPLQSANPNENGDQARALDNYGIYRVESYGGCPMTCPPATKSVFKLVYKSQFMRISQFAAPPSEDGSTSPYDTRSGKDYDLLLKKRAEDVSWRCNDPDSVEAPESTWVRDLLPRVFLPFDRKEEERLDRDRPFHHWYATTLSYRHMLMSKKSRLSASLSTWESTNHQL